MRTRVLLIVAFLGLALAMPCAAELGQAPFAVGFAVGVPYGLPVDWSGSFSVLTGEALLSRNLTVAFDIGTYPASFPDLYEASVSLLVKGWLGAVGFYAGGGFTARLHHIGSTWVSVPHLNLKAGAQAWILESLALAVQVRSIEALPVSWAFTPEISLGLTVAIGRARPATLFADGATLWILVGLGVAALIAFLPRI
jgi:hypothetical protein